MPWWVKGSSAAAVLLLLAALALGALSLEPPLNEKLGPLAVYVGLAGVFFAYSFVRAAWTWERLKFRAGAWMTGRLEARGRYQRRHRKD